MTYDTWSGESRIRLENETLRAVILPRMGGRVISLFHKGKGFEAAAQRGAGTWAGSVGSAENAFPFAPYAYGMDDAFPNIDEEDFIWRGRKLHYPDHGEIWRAECRTYGHGQESAVLTWESRIFSYCYEKRMKLEGSSLRIHYRIENMGTEELPAIWTWHGLMRYEEDMEILLPEETEAVRNVLDDPVLGREGTVHPVQGRLYDFTRVPPAEPRSAVKYYVESRVTEGRCGFYYPSADMACLLHYDAGKLPYLGVWITAGGFQGDYNCALEPTNGFYDSIKKASANKKLPVLGAGECMEFELEVILTEGKFIKAAEAKSRI